LFPPPLGLYDARQNDDRVGFMIAAQVIRGTFSVLRVVPVKRDGRQDFKAPGMVGSRPPDTHDAVEMLGNARDEAQRSVLKLESLAFEAPRFADSSGMLAPPLAYVSPEAIDAR
jgi:hypothetical protein